MEYVNSFKDLKVYKVSKELQKEIYDLSMRFPREEMYSLTDQVRRSSRSIGAAIAEAWAKRIYERHFVSKLTDSDGEQFETQHWIDTALSCSYISNEVSSSLLEKCEAIGKMLQSMIDKSHLFCKPKKFPKR